LARFAGFVLVEVAVEPAGAVTCALADDVSVPAAGA
jgi:hypothetical protein